MLKKIQRPKSAYERYFMEADVQEDNVSVTVAPRKNRGTDYDSVSETNDITVAPRKNRGTEYSAEDEPIENPDTGDEDSSYDSGEDTQEEQSDTDQVPEGPDTGDEDSEYDSETSDESGEYEPDDDDHQSEGPDTGDDDTDYSDSSESESQDGEQDNNSQEDTESNQESETEKNEKKKKYHMYKRFLHLYNVIDSFIERLRDIVSDNAVDNAVIKTVTDNLSDVQSALYDYMVIKYKKESYVQILVYFETVISLIRLNFELIRNNHINLKQYSKKELL